jgi:hypothetical protein
VCSAAILLSACGGADDASSAMALLDEGAQVVGETVEDGPLPEPWVEDPNATLLACDMGVFIGMPAPTYATEETPVGGKSKLNVAMFT